jgi:large subunit ribosomal protein L6
MSRIGKLPIEIPAKVEFSLSDDNVATVKGPLGVLSQKINPDIEVSVEDNKISFKRSSDEKNQRAMHGLYRSLVNNMVTGVSTGFELRLELVGVGYRAELTEPNLIDLTLGFSHHTLFQLPPEIQVEVKADKRSNPIIILKSCDKQLIGQVAAKIRSLRKPEPYKGKGIKFVNEVLRRKAGKAAGKQ